MQKRTTHRNPFRPQVETLPSEQAAEAHVEKAIAAKLRQGYVDRADAGVGPVATGSAGGADAITVARCMKAYMSEHSGGCRVVIRNADLVDAAAEALRRFCDDLYTSDLFAPLDVEFGHDLDGTPLRFSPSFASEVQLGTDGPEFWFDAKDILEAWPASGCASSGSAQGENPLGIDIGTMAAQCLVAPVVTART